MGRVHEEQETRLKNVFNVLSLILKSSKRRLTFGRDCQIQQKNPRTGAGAWVLSGTRGDLLRLN